MKNLVASIQDRLKNLSRSEDRPLNKILEDFALARLFARLNESAYADNFILKGAQLFKIWASDHHRPTRDADFLSFGSPDPAALETVFGEIVAVATDPPDGLEWKLLKAEPIRGDNLYGGVRIGLVAMLGRIRIPVQIDVGFGDTITPEATTADWPMVLDFPPVALRVYQPETAIAEKLHAAVELETANSRMKDFFDLWWLSLHREYDGTVLTDAVVATFERRGTALPVGLPVAFTELFYGRPDKQTQWNGFLRKSALDHIGLHDVIQQVSRFLETVINGAARHHHWSPEQGWTKRPP